MRLKQTPTIILTVICSVLIPCVATHGSEAFQDCISSLDNAKSRIHISYGSIDTLVATGLSSFHLSQDCTQQLSKLQTLKLDESGVRDSDLKVLLSVPTLKFLNLAKTRITDQGLVNLENLIHLRSLDLQHTEVTGTGLQHLSDARFLTSLNLALSPIQDEALSLLQRHLSLKRLNLNRTPITDAALAHLTGLRLKQLGLARTQVTDQGLAMLANIPTLEKLDLSGTQITAVGLRHLARLPRLRELNIRETPAKAEGLVPLAANQSLEKLLIDNVRTPDLEHLKRLTSLKSIALGLVNVPDEISTQFFKQTKILGSVSRRFEPSEEDRSAIRSSLRYHLATLSQRNGILDFTEAQWFSLDRSLLKATSKELYYPQKGWHLEHQDFQKISRTLGLKGLIFDGMPIKDRDLKSLGPISSLEHLSLGSKFHDTDFGTRYLEGMITDNALKVIGRMKLLQSLNLEGANIYGPGLKELEKLTLMRHLNLSYTPILGSRLRHLSAMKNLEYLDLTWTKIKDTDLEYITNFHDLEKINLSGTQVTDYAVGYLKQLPSLKWIDLRGTSMTNSGVTELKKFLPNLEILPVNGAPNESHPASPRSSPFW